MKRGSETQKSVEVQKEKSAKSTLFVSTMNTWMKNDKATAGNVFPSSSGCDPTALIRRLATTEWGEKALQYTKMCGIGEEDTDGLITRTQHLELHHLNRDFNDILSVHDAIQRAISELSPLPHYRMYIPSWMLDPSARGRSVRLLIMHFPPVEEHCLLKGNTHAERTNVEKDGKTPTIQILPYMHALFIHT